MARLLAVSALAASLASCGGAAATASPALATPVPTAAASSVDITLQEWAVVPGQASVKAGTVTFKVTNKGPKNTHEFVVFRTDLGQRALPTGADGKVDEAGAGVTAIGEIEDIAVGTTGNVSFDLAPGKYVLVCNIVETVDGKTEVHYGLGMSADFTVE